MGGAWDSTNTADGDVAVFAPIDIDHADRLGETIAEIADGEGGDHQGRCRRRVGARRIPTPRRCCAPPQPTKGATIAFEGADFALTEQRLAVGGQLISVRGLAGTLRRRVPAALRRAPGLQRRTRDRRGRVAHRRRLPRRSPATSSPRASARRRRPAACSSSASRPTVLVDAAHNPHGARALATALRESFDFDEWGVVLGVLDDKDAAGIVAALAPVAAHVFATAPEIGARERRRPHRRPRRGARAAGHGPHRSRGRRRGGARLGCGIRSSCRRDRGLGGPRGRGARARDRRGLEGGWDE